MWGWSALAFRGNSLPRSSLGKRRLSNLSSHCLYSGGCRDFELDCGVASEAPNLEKPHRTTPGPGNPAGSNQPEQTVLLADVLSQACPSLICSLCSQWLPKRHREWPTHSSCHLLVQPWESKLDTGDFKCFLDLRVYPGPAHPLGELCWLIGSAKSCSFFFCGYHYLRLPPSSPPAIVLNLRLAPLNLLAQGCLHNCARWILALFPLMEPASAIPYTRLLLQGPCSLFTLFLLLSLCPGSYNW